eukprot:358516-Chlamydomonas_euryale.AAC.6
MSCAVPEAQPGGQPDCQPLHRVRVLRVQLPVQGHHADATPAHHSVPRAQPPAGGRCACRGVGGDAWEGRAEPAGYARSTPCRWALRMSGCGRGCVGGTRRASWLRSLNRLQ